MLRAMSKRLEAIETMLAKRPDDPFVHYARAMELRSLARLDDALAAFDGVMSRFPDYVPSHLMAAQVASELGRADAARAYASRGAEVASRVGDGHALSELQQFLATVG